MQNNEHLINLYRQMVKIRKFEEKVTRLYFDSEIPGFVHLYVGEEAIAAGVCANLNKDDYITSTHRGHGHLIAKGGDLKLMMAELYGKKEGYCHGKGGSMHIADLDLGILGANGIVGGGLPIAVGAGYSIKLRRTRQVSVVFFGDGASNEGTFHEAMNMAAAFNLAVIFVLENNQFGVSTRINRVTRESDLAKRAVGYGMPSVTIDGNDVLEVERVSGQAIENARNGKGPMLIVARTWRHHGHNEGEASTYWDQNEVNAWKAKCPIHNMKNYLLDYVKVPADNIAAIEKEVDTMLEEAVEFARKGVYPKPEEALEGLFSGGCNQCGK